MIHDILMAAAGNAVAGKITGVLATSSTAYTTTTTGILSVGSHGIGTARADRYVLVSFAKRLATYPILSCTIGGVSATYIGEVGSTTGRASIWCAAIPSGINAEIVATIASGAVQAYSVSVISVSASGFPSIATPVVADVTAAGAYASAENPSIPFIRNSLVFGTCITGPDGSTGNTRVSTGYSFQQTTGGTMSASVTATLTDVAWTGLTEVSDFVISTGLITNGATRLAFAVII